MFDDLLDNDIKDSYDYTLRTVRQYVPNKYIELNCAQSEIKVKANIKNKRDRNIKYECNLIVNYTKFSVEYAVYIINNNYQVALIDVPTLHLKFAFNDLEYRRFVNFYACKFNFLNKK